jgi:ubiquinone/menaquinone biosynthesis C-methylase UbiE
MTNPVQAYFDRAALDFDSIYGGKNRLGSWMDRLFRKDMHERFRLTFETLGEVAGKKVIDIGCGSGRYSVEFAKRGAALVTGIDFAPEMVRIAKQNADFQGVGEYCHFMVGDFFKMGFDRKFDISLAIGVFDYVDQPGVFLEKMRAVTKEWLILSFPSQSLLRTPIRKFRYWWKDCPVYFYDRSTIGNLVQGMGQARVTKIPGQGMDFFVAIQLAGA